MRRFVDASSSRVREPDMETAIKYLQASTATLQDRRVLFYAAKKAHDAFYEGYAATGRVDELNRLETQLSDLSQRRANATPAVRDAISKQ